MNKEPDFMELEEPGLAAEAASPVDLPCYAAVPDEALFRLKKIEHSTDVPARWIRMMAAEIMELRGTIEILEKAND